MPIPIKVFISYAHYDREYFEVFKRELLMHLKTYREYDFDVWEDSRLLIGTKWDEAIRKNLEDTQLAILCVSAAFLESEYVEKVEVASLIQQFGKTLLAPVYFKRCNTLAWQGFSSIQFFMPPGKEYNVFDDDFAFCDLVAFNRANGQLVDNAEIGNYVKDLTVAIEKILNAQYLVKSEPITARATEQVTEKTADETASDVDDHKKPILEENKLLKLITVTNLLNLVLIAVMIWAAKIVFQNLNISGAFTANEPFKSCMGGVMFFGCLAGVVYLNPVRRSKI